jgi:hypothetical protein
MKSILTSLIFLITITAYSQNCNNNLTPKILLIGDNKESAVIDFPNSIQGFYIAQLFDENVNLIGLMKLVVQ